MLIIFCNYRLRILKNFSSLCVRISMMRRMFLLLRRWGFSNVIHVFLLLHFSFLAIVSTAGYSGLIQFKIINRNSTRRSNNSAIYYSALHLNRQIRLNKVKKSPRLSASTYNHNFSNLKFAYYPLLRVQKLKEFINSFIEFRPPPTFLS